MIIPVSAVIRNFDQSQHLALVGVTWAYYEHTLEQIGNRAIRVNFLDGKIEIISPLPEHEALKTAIARLVEMLTFERGIRHKSFGSTTFRKEEAGAGLEPDNCYYFNNIDSVKGMKRFDPTIHRAPDLAIEIDIFSPSIPREPIYARLGVPEIWRYNGRRVEVRVLVDGEAYETSAASPTFPFLPIGEFAKFIAPMIDDDETQVLYQFRDWVRTLQT